MKAAHTAGPTEADDSQDLRQTGRSGDVAPSGIVQQHHSLQLSSVIAEINSLKARMAHMEGPTEADDSQDLRQTGRSGDAAPSGIVQQHHSLQLASVIAEINSLKARMACVTGPDQAGDSQDGRQARRSATVPPADVAQQQHSQQLASVTAELNSLKTRMVAAIIDVSPSDVLQHQHSQQLASVTAELNTLKARMARVLQSSEADENQDLQRATRSDDVSPSDVLQQHSQQLASVTAQLNALKLRMTRVTGPDPADDSPDPQQTARSDDASPAEGILQKLSQHLASVAAELSSLKARMDLSTTSVGFQVRKSVDPFAVAKGAPIVFDLVITNVGNAYDNQTGFFTAPVAGLYAFHATCMAVFSSSFGVSVVADDVCVGQCWSTSTGNSELGSTYVTVHLGAGGRVWARSEHSQSVRGCFWTTLGGHLVTADG